MTSLSVSQARSELPALLSRVAAGEEVTITRHGQPVAVLVRPDVLRRRRAAPAVTAAAHLGGLLESARLATELPADGLSRTRADELVAQVRADRDRT